MSQLFELLKTDTFWTLFAAGIIYLSGAWLRPVIAKIPPSNILFRTIRVLHLVLNKVDPGGNEATKTTKTITTAAFLICLASLSQTACAGSFEEARLANATAARKTEQRDDNECKAIDGRYRLWGGIETGALAATGASGLSTIPVSNDTGKAALAVTAVVFAGAAAVSHFEANQYATRWAEECSAK